MSSPLIARSDDLRRLRDEGYNIEERGGLLLMKDIPYITAERTVARGVLVTALELSGDTTVSPTDHVAMWQGAYPCDANGQPINAIRHAGADNLGGGVRVDFKFSSKPKSGRYESYHHKMTAYCAVIQNHAQAVDPEVTAKTSPVVPDEEDDPVFAYRDTATVRAGIGAASDRLADLNVAIVGLGGSGSYVLDLVAKTPVRQIHLFDGDSFLTHNAFRTPGAATIEELRAQPTKVAYLHAKYSALHLGVVPHPYPVTESNVDELDGVDFVFVCIDVGSAKRPIVDHLNKLGTPFVDVGMGVYRHEDRLGGQLRVTASDHAHRDHVARRVSFAEPRPADEYNHNIQLADLNAANAALAVIRWKKLFGFYVDHGGDFNATYRITTNDIVNEEGDDSQ